METPFSEDGESELDDEPELEESEPEMELTESMEGIDPSLCVAEQSLTPWASILPTRFFQRLPILGQNVYL
jgi:hypothetical protein